VTGEPQFIRRWGLFVADPTSGNGVVLADGSDEPEQETLHIRFEVHQADAQQLTNHAVIKVWNPPADIVGKMRQYTRVVLQAGYKYGKYGKIFDGWIVYFRYGHETAVDSYLELHCADGDLGVSFSTVNKTLMPGSNSYLQQTEVLAGEFGEWSIQKPDALPQSAGGASPQSRSTVLFGATRDEFESIRKTNGWLWSVQNGKLQVTEAENAITKAGEGVELNAQTGLIGWPTVVSDGVEARSLLNPAIFVKEQVKIDNASVNRSVGTGVGSTGNEFMVAYPSPAAGFTFFAPTSTDGMYIAYVVEHIGDSRGQEWYTDLVLWAIDSKTGQALQMDGLLPDSGTIDKEGSASVSEDFARAEAATNDLVRKGAT
jgi:hypothetical protein